MLAGVTNTTGVRERTLWALRVYGLALRSDDAFLKAVKAVLQEPRTVANKMLRYDAAYMLCMLQGKAAPKAALDTMLAYLEDEWMLIYAGATAAVSHAAEMHNQVQSELQREVQQGQPRQAWVCGTCLVMWGNTDGRIIALDALRAVGAEVLRGRPDIVKQIKHLAKAARDKTLKEKCELLLTEFSL